MTPLCDGQYKRSSAILLSPLDRLRPAHRPQAALQAWIPGHTTTTLYAITGLFRSRRAATNTECSKKRTGQVSSASDHRSHPPYRLTLMPPPPRTICASASIPHRRPLRASFARMTALRSADQFSPDHPCGRACPARPRHGQTRAIASSGSRRYSNRDHKIAAT